LKGITQNYQLATQWFTLAAEKGNDDARRNLGNSNEYGHGVIQNFTRAHMWYNIAASLGHKLAKKNRVSIAKDMTTSQIAKAQLLASECVEKNYKDC
jgi:TPR repeat protein